MTSWIPSPTTKSLQLKRRAVLAAKLQTGAHHCDPDLAAVFFIGTIDQQRCQQGTADGGGGGTMSDLRRKQRLGYLIDVVRALIRQHRETSKWRQVQHVTVDDAFGAIEVGTKCPETGTYSNKNRETIAEKRAITMRD
jgi:hypothetical protein